MNQYFPLIGERSSNSDFIRPRAGNIPESVNITIHEGESQEISFNTRSMDVLTHANTIRTESIRPNDVNSSPSENFRVHEVQSREAIHNSRPLHSSILYN